MKNVSARKSSYDPNMTLLSLYPKPKPTKVLGTTLKEPTQVLACHLKPH